MTKTLADATADLDALLGVVSVDKPHEHGPVRPAKPQPPPHTNPDEVWFLVSEALVVERVVCEACGHEWEVPHGIYHHFRTDTGRAKQERWHAPAGSAGPHVKRAIKTIMSRKAGACRNCFEADVDEPATWKAEDWI